ncbi:MAG TPA: hypothetical protein VNG53_03540 [Bacteroidia bacterium]|nr:hypothetical protein [Bacteroidia bacterium]
MVGKITEEGKRLDGATVTVFKNGSQTQQIVSPNGKFEVVMDPDADYILSFTKDALVTKKLTFTTRNVPVEVSKLHSFALDIGEVSLFVLPQGAAASKITAILDQPIGRFAYSPTIKDFDVDAAYTASMEAKLDLIKQAEEQAKELEKQYDDAISKGDKAFSNGDWSGAQAAYNNALKLTPDAKYPQNQIVIVNKKIADKAAADAIAAKQKALDAQYQTLIASADKSLSGKDYATAKTSYTQASALKPNEQYPKDKLAEIDKDLANAQAAADAAAKQKALDAQYQTLIASADKSLSSKDYTTAKTSYTQASALKPNEQYPKDKIAEIDKDLANAQSAADAAAKQKALDAQYQTLIASADKSFSVKDYDNAKTSYTQASSLKPTEQYPKDKLAELDKEIAKEQAANSAQKALDDQYNAAITAADQLLAAKNYDNAKKGYNSALILKPAAKYPQDKIKEIDKDLADLAASNNEKAEEEAKKIALDKKYNDLISTADEEYGGLKYDEAITEYKEASALKPNEEYPKDKIAEINNKLITLAEAKKKDAKYNAIIAKADQQFAAKDFKLSQTFYQQASDLKPEEQYPKDKLKNIYNLLHPKKEIAVDKSPTNTTTADSTVPARDSINPLAKEYPQGVTEKHTQDANTDVTIRIVVRGVNAYVYKKVVWNFGQVDYYKNDIPITRSTYDNETSQ